METTKAPEEKAGRGRPPKSKVLDQILSEDSPQKELDQNQKVPVITTQKYLTPDEQAIYGRVMAESQDWRTITEESAEDFSLSRNPFELPEPAKKLRANKEFAFRWITRKPERVDEIKNKPVPFRWWIVNLTQPVGGIFKPFIDPNNGCVSREDQMLVFKPYWMFEKELAHKRRLAEAHDGGIEAKNGEKRGDTEFKAGKRRGTERETLRQEIKGSDIQYRGEEEVDIAAGRSFPAVTDSDLVIEE